MIRNHILDPNSVGKRGERGDVAVNESIRSTNGQPDNDDGWYGASVASGQSGPMQAPQNSYGQSYGGVSSYNMPDSAQNNHQYGMGTMGGSLGGGLSNSIYDDEPPLLEELGIRPSHIVSKTKAVLYVHKVVGGDILDDTDLAGPLLFCLGLGSCLLLAGKIHFGIIYGFSACGCLAMYTIINLIHPTGLDFWRICSVLGYCLLPVICLAAASIVIDLVSYTGLAMSALSVGWATHSATRLLDATLKLTDMYWLVAYPIMLLYCCFVLITVF